MRQFSILLVFVVAFGGAAVLYEQESRKVKGVLSQITDLQAKVGDMQAEIKRLNAELESVKLAERRRPNLNTVASRVLKNESVKTRPVAQAGAGEQGRGVFTGDVTTSAPAIRGRGESGEDGEWAKPSVDAEVYEAQAGSGDSAPLADPYQ
ncbi:hypothetical protein Mag101_07220 [Microbulbifer agarilyticus]|uniref:Uncharacterized protein n=1 Tax=Microbulbifer agarilyticus TaxID=260552 RepID=A0A1Q2M423_9GAMM|nr:hypothetical protein [Microbulbifer agarilyticus]AQQ67451.1 hypothetical protein Mag101_07220 [Microbulbifer agarilyticus]